MQHNALAYRDAEVKNRPIGPQQPSLKTDFGVIGKNCERFDDSNSRENVEEEKFVGEPEKGFFYTFRN